MTYIGIDPGRSGGIAAIDSKNSQLSAVPMPISSDRGIDLMATKLILASGQVSRTEWEGLSDAPVTYAERIVAAIEWNTARPGEVPDRAMIFGIQTGQLDALLWSMGAEIVRVSPQAWMNSLGLPGKKYDHGYKQRMEVVARHFDGAEVLYTGPKGGILDGVLEAICMAIYIRLVTESPVGKMGGRRKPKFT